MFDELSRKSLKGIIPNNEIDEFLKRYQLALKEQDEVFAPMLEAVRRSEQFTAEDYKVVINY